MQKIKVCALFGKSASGKDTIQNCITSWCSKDTHKIISCTTRPPRQGEIEGESYFFLHSIEFKQKIETNQMLEYTEFRNWYYGTSIDQLDLNKINVGVFNPAGVRSLLQDPRLEVQAVYIAAADKIRLLRSLDREQQPDCHEICRRFLTDEEDFADIDDIASAVWDNNTNFLNPATVFSNFNRLYPLAEIG